LQRGLANPRREFFHGDKRVADYRATGEIEPPGPYEPPRLNLPTLYVRTERDYAPSLSEIVAFIASRGEGGALGR
jgi:hypothetical protein